MRTLSDIATLDRHWLIAAGRLPSPLLRASRALSRSADGYLYLLVPLLLLALNSPGAWLLAQHAALAFALERGLYWALKNGVRRRRPAQCLPDFHSRIIAADEFSMPSGHTSGAFLFVTLLCLHYGPLPALLYPWAVCVALSRVCLGVHFPSDTLLGALLGSSLGLLTVSVLL
jgi:undecaprenyl-diphosphatase